MKKKIIAGSGGTRQKRKKGKTSYAWSWNNGWQNLMGECSVLAQPNNNADNGKLHEFIDENGETQEGVLAIDTDHIKFEDEEGNAEFGYSDIKDWVKEQETHYWHPKGYAQQPNRWKGDSRRYCRVHYLRDQFKVLEWNLKCALGERKEVEKWTYVPFPLQTTDDPLTDVIWGTRNLIHRKLLDMDMDYQIHDTWRCYNDTHLDKLDLKQQRIKHVDDVGYRTNGGKHIPERVLDRYDVYWHLSDEDGDTNLDKGYDFIDAVWTEGENGKSDWVDYYWEYLPQELQWDNTRYGSKKDEHKSHSYRRYYEMGEPKLGYNHNVQRMFEKGGTYTVKLGRYTVDMDFDYTKGTLPAKHSQDDKFKYDSMFIHKHSYMKNVDAASTTESKRCYMIFGDVNSESGVNNNLFVNELEKDRLNAMMAGDDNVKFGDISFGWKFHYGKTNKKHFLFKGLHFCQNDFATVESCTCGKNTCNVGQYCYYKFFPQPDPLSESEAFDREGYCSDQRLFMCTALDKDRNYVSTNMDIKPRYSDCVCGTYKNQNDEWLPKMVDYHEGRYVSCNYELNIHAQADQKALVPILGPSCEHYDGTYMNTKRCACYTTWNVNNTITKEIDASPKNYTLYSELGKCSGKATTEFDVSHEDPAHECMQKCLDNDPTFRFFYLHLEDEKCYCMVSCNTIESSFDFVSYKIETNENGPLARKNLPKILQNVSYSQAQDGLTVAEAEQHVIWSDLLNGEYCDRARKNVQKKAYRLVQEGTCGDVYEQSSTSGWMHLSNPDECVEGAMALDDLTLTVSEDVYTTRSNQEQPGCSFDKGGFLLLFNDAFKDNEMTCDITHAENPGRSGCVCSLTGERCDNVHGEEVSEGCICGSELCGLTVDERCKCSYEGFKTEDSCVGEWSLSFCSGENSLNKQECDSVKWHESSCDIAPAFNSDEANCEAISYIEGYCSDSSIKQKIVLRKIQIY